MKTFNQIQAFQNDMAYVYALREGNNFPPAYQYKNMYYSTRVEAPVLAKRPIQTIDEILSEEIYKKIKSSTLQNNNSHHSSFSSDPFKQDYDLKIQTNTFSPSDLSTVYQARSEQRKVQSSQNVHLLMALKQQQDNLMTLNHSYLLNKQYKSYQNDHSTLMSKSLKGNIYVKQEETYQNKHLLSPETYHKSPITDSKIGMYVKDYSCSTSSAENNDIGQVFEDEKEPVLTEFTKAFPEWDLPTIFGFLNSEKSKEAFEKEKNYKNERKLIKAQIRLEKKERQREAASKANKSSENESKSTRKTKNLSE